MANSERHWPPRRRPLNSLPKTVIAGQGRNNTADIHFPNDTIVSISNIKIAGTVHSDTTQPIQSGVGGEAAVSRIAPTAIAGHGRDHPAGIHFADDTVATISNVKIALTVHSETIGPIQSGIGRGAAVSE